MWRRLRKQIDVEREMLRQLMADHAPLLKKCVVSEPDRIEQSALGAMLQCFYNGIENVFKRVTVELGEAMPRVEGWHRVLLEEMTRSTAKRPALISEALAQKLEEYLRFRHFFRSAYSFQLRWERMADLATGCRNSLDRLETELDVFLNATRDRE